MTSSACSRRSSCSAGRGPVGAAGHLVERLAGPDAQEDAPREHLLERHEGLRDDRRVVAVHERRDARADRQPPGRLPGRAEPDPRVAGLAAGPPRREVVRAREPVEPGVLGGHGLAQQLARSELLVRGAEPEPGLGHVRTLPARAIPATAVRGAGPQLGAVA